MGRWLRTRLVFLLIGVVAAAAATWILPTWSLQPSPARAVGPMTRHEYATWTACHRAETRCCLALNAVWFSAAVWLVVGGSEIVRARGLVPPSWSRRT
jgi:hypothetical protein